MEINKKKENKKISNEKYYRTHKDVVLGKLKEKILCTFCNKEVNKSSYTRHCSSTYHKKRKNIYDSDDEDKAS
jgi:uncharacterized protein YktA (UPF0223 family)